MVALSSKDLLVDILAWASLLFYFVCFIPQIIKNYRIKSASGLSSYTLIAYCIGYLSMLLYVFCLDLILPYKIIVPLEFGAVSVIIGQRFYYDGLFADRALFWVVASSVFIACLLTPLALLYPYEIGSMSGWVSLVMFVAYPIPQVIKVFRERSVKGFSFGFVTLLAMAGGSELLVALIRDLPLQTLLTATKGVVVYIIFCIQFLLYAKKPTKLYAPE